MKIIQTLKEKRKEHQLTQEQLAEKIFVSTKTISNWETGKTKPDIENLILLAKLFDLSLDDLLLEGSEIVESINNDVKKGRNLKKIILVVALPLLLIIVFLTWKSYQGSTMSIVPIEDISSIKLSTEGLTPETKISGKLQLNKNESFRFVDATLDENTLYLMIYKKRNLFEHNTQFEFDLSTRSELTSQSLVEIETIVLTYWDTKEMDGFGLNQLSNDFPKKVIWER